LNYDINKGNRKIDFSFPSPNKNFDFFVRYFNGYGESLVDYNIKIERISFGFLLADWI
jgi:phospholipase A1